MSDQLSAAAIEKVEALVLEANGIIKAPDRVGDVYYVREPNRSLRRVIGDPGPLSIEAVDLHCLVQFLKQAKETEGANRMFVLASPAEVRAVAMLADGRRTVAVLRTAIAEPFAWLHRLNMNTCLSPSHLYNTMRMYFPGSVDMSVMEAFKRVKFESSDESESTIDNSQAGLSRRVQNKVAGENGTALPEMIVFKTPVRKCPDMAIDKFEVETTVIVHHDERGFAVLPVPGALEAADQAALEKLTELLRQDLSDSGLGDAVPILFGSANL